MGTLRSNTSEFLPLISPGSFLETHFSRGSPACFQAPIPPPSENTWPKPCLRRVATALSERLPLSQTTITGLALYFSSSEERASSCPIARCREFSTCPPSYSAASRTSNTRAFCWLISSVAWSVEIEGPAVLRRMAGQTSIEPLTAASATRKTCSVRNFSRLTSPMSRARNAAENFAHGGKELQCALIPDGIVHAVRFSSGAENPLPAENRQVLRHVALRCPHSLDDVVHTRFLLPEDAKDLQTQRMGDRPHGVRHLLNLFTPADQREDVPGLTRRSLLSNFHGRSL